MLNKLVRDKIPQDMESHGQVVHSRVLGDEEYLQELARKAVEEAREFNLADAEGAPKELADLLTIVMAGCAALGMTFEELQALEAKCTAERGGFSERIYVERLDLQGDDNWVDYYAADPTKFPEIKE